MRLHFFQGEVEKRSFSRYLVENVRETSTGPQAGREEMKMESEEKQRRGGVPLYARIGWVVAWGVMAVIVAMILRNCAASVYYGTRTTREEVKRYYELGRGDGLGGGRARGLDLDNPVLRKSYNKGYRDGLDAAADR